MKQTIHSIRLLNPFGVYPEIDRFGRTISLDSSSIIQMLSHLAAQYPEFCNEHYGRSMLIGIRCSVSLTLGSLSRQRPRY
jgi:hypothetical protein